MLGMQAGECSEALPCAGKQVSVLRPYSVQASDSMSNFPVVCMQARQRSKPLSFDRQACRCWVSLHGAGKQFSVQAAAQEVGLSRRGASHSSTAVRLGASQPGLCQEEGGKKRGQAQEAAVCALQDQPSALPSDLQGKCPPRVAL